MIPMGLLYVAEACRERGYSPMIVMLAEAARLVADVERDDWSEACWSSLVARLLRATKPRAVGIGCHWSYQNSGALRTASWVKAIDPTIHVTLGGVHAGAMAEEFLAHTKDVDSVIIGDGERAYPDLLDALGTGNESATDGALVRRGDRISGTATAAPAAPSDLPRLSLAPDLIWPPGRGRIIGLPFVRGRCPMPCTFCSLNSQRLYPKQRAAMIDTIAEQLPVFIERGIPLYLPENIAGPAPLEALAGALEESGRARAVFADLHPGVVTGRVLDALARIADKTESLRIWIGVESGAVSVRERAGRRIANGEILGVFDRVRRAGITRVMASVMVGLPGEREADVMSTDRLIAELNDRGILSNVFPCVAFPETALYREHGAFGIRLRMWGVSGFDRLSTSWFAPMDAGAISFDTETFDAHARVEATLKLRLRQRNRLGYRVTPELFRMMEHLPDLRVVGEAEAMTERFEHYLEGERFGGRVRPTRFWNLEEEV